jgi:hypothetical protein
MNTYYNGRSSFPRRVFGIRLKVDAEVETIAPNLNLISHTVASVSAAWQRHS